MNGSGGALPSGETREDRYRTYVCPACGYDGFRAGPVKFSGLTDVNLQFGCPYCGAWLVETSDPRDETVRG